MKVLFVINGYYTKGNGLSGSARRTVKKLKEAGIDVKVLSVRNSDPNGPQPDFVLSDFHIPLFDTLVKKQGYEFSKTDKSVIREAVSWADVVHLEEPFFLQYETCKIAKELNKPLTGTYHLHPENLFASVGLDRVHFFNKRTMIIWRDYVFNNCKILQCPTENVKGRLLRYKFKPELRVISNGLVMEDLLTKTDEDIKDTDINDAKYRIITIGRFSAEKDLTTLLKAMKYCRHSQDIRLIFAGRGPKKNKLERMANRLVKRGILKYPPIFGFYTLKELQKLSCSVDLYIHCAYIEVEGLSCMEAIQVGIVPIIAKGRYTATSQFALTDMSTYLSKDPKDLADKIDYWLDHDELRKEEAKKYIGLGNKYNIDYSIQQTIKMFEDALK